MTHDPEAVDRDPPAMSPAEEAATRFSTFAGMGAPELPEDALDKVQVQLHRWQINKFGYQPMELMPLGITEEMGELEDAQMEGDHPEIYDAVGDILVYTSQLLTHSRLSLGSAIHDQEQLSPGDGLMSAAGKLSQVVLKRVQRIRGMDNNHVWRETLYERVITLLATVRIYSGYGLDEAVLKVADHVMARKGNMHPKTAG